LFFVIIVVFDITLDPITYRYGSFKIMRFHGRPDNSAAMMASELYLAMKRGKCTAIDLDMGAASNCKAKYCCFTMTMAIVKKAPAPLSSEEVKEEHRVQSKVLHQ